MRQTTYWCWIIYDIIDIKQQKKKESITDRI